MTQAISGAMAPPRVRRERSMRRGRRIYAWVGGIVALVLCTGIFLVPFAFIFLTAVKDGAESSQLSFSLPTSWHVVDNFMTVISMRDFQLLRALLNSTVLTVGSVAIMVIASALAGYVLQRRRSRLNPVINFFILAGLIVPPAVVPTIWLLQGIGLFKTMPGMILVEATFGLPFCILLFRAFMATIPKELDEAATLDGAGPIRLFLLVILPLLRPVLVTIIVIQSVAVFNDFTGPLYFLPGSDNVTVQLTLYNFLAGGLAQTLSQWNLLFMSIALITIPPLVAYICFHRRITAGMTSGAIKG